MSLYPLFGRQEESSAYKHTRDTPQPQRDPLVMPISSSSSSSMTNRLMEGLVTTLLSLEYINQPSGSLAPLPYKTSFHRRTKSVAPLHCRSRGGTRLSLTAFEEEDEQEDFLSSNTTASYRWDMDTTATIAMATSVSSTPVDLKSKKTHEYHCPPSSFGTDNTDTKTKGTSDSDYYDSNDTVFGAILRGDLPALTLSESSRLVALQDIHPRAPLHALIIPKAFVGSIFDVVDHDLEWLQEMHAMALELVNRYHPQAFATGDYRLVFHIPPFHSVHHLHLHVLAPLSKMAWYYKHIKYLPGARWCMELDTVLERLRRGEANGVPYPKPPLYRPQRQSMTTSTPTMNGNATTARTVTASTPVANKNTTRIIKLEGDNNNQSSCT